MKILIYVIATACFLLGMFYGYASSPNYQKILSYSIACEVIALLGFGYGVANSKGCWRLLFCVTCGLALVVLWQATSRFITISLR